MGMGFFDFVGDAVHTVGNAVGNVAQDIGNVVSNPINDLAIGAAAFGAPEFLGADASVTPAISAGYGSLTDAATASGISGSGSAALDAAGTSLTGSAIGSGLGAGTAAIDTLGATPFVDSSLASSSALAPGVDSFLATTGGIGADTAAALGIGSGGTDVPMLMPSLSQTAAPGMSSYMATDPLTQAAMSDTAQAATTAGENTVSQPWYEKGYEKALNYVGNNPFQAAELGLLGASMFGSKPQVPLNSTLMNNAAPLNTTANSLLTKFNSGQMTASDQVNIANYQQQQAASIKQQYATMGMAGSTMEAQALAGVGQTAVTMAQQALNNELQQALLAASGGSAQTLQAVQLQVAQDQQLQQAQTSLLQAMAMMSVGAKAAPQA